MEKYIDYEMCKKCGGACCKQNGCVYAPSDEVAEYRLML